METNDSNVANFSLEAMEARGQWWKTGNPMNREFCVQWNNSSGMKENVKIGCKLRKWIKCITSMCIRHLKRRYLVISHDTRKTLWSLGNMEKLGRKYVSKTNTFLN